MAPWGDEKWYDRYFGEDYLRIYRFADTEDQLRFLQAVLGEGQGRRLLDVACGQGRHAVALAEWGFEVWGLDRSEPLLRVACETARRLRRKVGYLRADVRAFPLGDALFDVAISMFTSFGYFEDEEENQQVLREVARVLKPGGTFILDLANLDFVRSHPPVSQWEHRGAKVSSRYFYDPFARRALTRRTVELDGQVKVYESSVRIYSREEILQRLAAAGLQAMDCYGGYDLSPLTPQSRRMILVARRR